MDSPAHGIPIEQSNHPRWTAPATALVVLAVLAARRPNVTVSIDVDLDLRRRQEAETAARALTAAILADLRLR